MPRKPTRYRRLLPVQPLTFSPFARSVARAATAYLVKHHRHRAKLQQTGNEFKGKLKDVDKQYESSGDEDFDGVIQADFAFFDPKPDDFHSVKVLLQSYLDNMEWDLSGFVDLILGQTTVGTVVKLEDDEDNGVFSVITALNLERYKAHAMTDRTVKMADTVHWDILACKQAFVHDHKCIVELKQYLLKICQEKDKISNLKSLLGEKAHSVGILVSQRVVNLPPELLPHLYDSLFDEVLWATEDEPTEDLRNSFRFEVYILVSKIYKQKNENKKRPPSTDKEEPIIYIKPEDEIFHKLSMWSFLFPLSTQQASTHELKNYQLTGIVMAIKAEHVPSFRQQLHTMIKEP